MENLLRYCIDQPSTKRGSGFEAIVAKEKVWPNGTTLRVNFSKGTDEQHDNIKKWVQKWSDIANVAFDFGDDPYAEIRVGFTLKIGSWSAVGTDALNTSPDYFPLSSRTMNFGWEPDQATVLHEFGHALGLEHEHQNPKGGIIWNDAVVKNEMAKQNWSERKTVRNILRKYSSDYVNGTEFDPHSIMLYFFPPEWTLNGIGTQQNQDLSETDKRFIASVYSRSAAKTVLPVDIPVDVQSFTRVFVEKAGYEHFFTFDVPKHGTYLIETDESPESVSRIYRSTVANAATLIKTEYCIGNNSRAVVSVELAEGSYMLAVRQYANLQNVGATYGIRVVALR